MSLFEIAKDAVKLAKAVGDIPLLEKILDVQHQALALMQDNDRLRTENIGLQAQLRRRGQVVVNFGVYWERLDDGLLDGPFSPNHWDLDGKLVRLAHESVGEFTGAPVGQHHQYVCRTTKAYFYVPVEFMVPAKVKNADQLPRQMIPVLRPKAGSWDMRPPR